MVFFGSSTYASLEAIDRLQENSIFINSMRIKAFPFQADVFNFINRHEIVFIIEQNRDSQMKILISGECQVSPGKIVSVTHFNGLPITATIITNRIHSTLLTCGKDFLSSKTVVPEVLS
jgi:2-oxoglutarate ferredoxin oxidoreductase subunit alpha